MRFALPAIVIAASLGFVAGPVCALQVVRTANTTVLGQPLDFAATVRLEAGEELTPDCVQADVVVGDRLLPAQAVRVAMDGGGGERRVRVRTVVPVDEPIAQVTVKLGCPMRYSRSFVAFVDPPGVQLAQASPASAPVAPAAAPSSAPLGAPPAFAGRATAAPAGDAATPKSAARRDPATGQASGTAVRPRSERPATVARAPEVGQRAGSAQAVAPARERPQPRLRLDPVEPLPGREAASDGRVPSAPPGLSPDTGSAAAPAPAASGAQAADAASEVAGAASSPDDVALRALEAALDQMRAEAAETQRAVAVLQARLAEAEQQRANHQPVLYALVIALIGLTTALLIVTSRLRQAQRERGQWPPSALHEGPRPATEEPAPLTEVTDAPDTRLTSPSTQSTQPAAGPAFAGSVTTSLGAFGTSTDVRRGLPPASPIPAPEARREVTVEELIDLEQQAEFFIVLGQDEAAIDVLMGHLRSTGGQTPLPYLKLLEIYRRREDREAYERIRERFNRRFNAYAPEWGADLQKGRSLDDYPAAITRLQQVWPDPVAAMELLEQSLLRQGEDVGTYDLPAYREVLLLYSVARDIAERRQPDSVDLLLPLTDDVTAPAAFDTTGYGRTGPGGARDFETGLDVPGTDFDRRTRYETDFSFDSSAFLAGSPNPPPDRRR